MAIFEAGIITKMNENEYEKLGKQKELSSQAAESVSAEIKKDTIRQGKGKESNEKLRPISLKMLQGAFYVLSLGNIFSGNQTVCSRFDNMRNNLKTYNCKFSLFTLWNYF